MPIINPLNINNYLNVRLANYTATATLTSSGWSSTAEGYMQTVSVPNMTADAIVFVSPAYSSSNNYYEWYTTDKIVCTAQATGTLTFRRYASSSSGDIQVSLMWFDNGNAPAQVVHTFDWSGAGQGDLDDGSTLSDLYQEFQAGKLVYIDIDSSGGSDYILVKQITLTSNTYSLEATGIKSGSNNIIRLYVSGAAASSTRLYVKYANVAWAN